MTSPLKEYELLDCIGHGTFGRVHLAKHIPTSTTVAIKIIHLDRSPSLTTLRSEIESLKMACSHANIVKYFNSLIVEGEVWIVMEYCELGSLRNFLEGKTGREGSGLNESVVWYVATRVLEALAFLHSRNIIHRDLKAANILVTKDYSIKLADFGVAITDDKRTSVEVAGSPYWMAPEVIKEHKSSFASDIWSFGITVIELLTGNPPYAELSPAAAVRKIASDLPPVLSVGSSELRRMVERCLHDDPVQRPTAVELLGQMKKADVKAFKELCSLMPSVTRLNDNAPPPIEADRRTLTSEWTFGATISSDFTLKTWLDDTTTPNDIDMRLWERQRVLQEEASQMVSPVMSSTQPSRTDTIPIDEGNGKKLLTSSLEPKTVYSEEELSSLIKLVKAKKLACPHICPNLDAKSILTELTRSTVTQTEEQKKISERIDHLIKEYGPVQASFEYVKGEEDIH